MDDFIDFKQIKEQIIETDAILKKNALLKKNVLLKNKQFLQLTNDFEIFKLEYDRKMFHFDEEKKQCENYKAQNLILQSENSSMKEEYNKSLNDYQTLHIKYQTVCKKLEENVALVNKYKNSQLSIKTRKSCKKIKCEASEPFEDDYSTYSANESDEEGKLLEMKLTEIPEEVEEVTEIPVIKQCGVKEINNESEEIISALKMKITYLTDSNNMLKEEVTKCNERIRTLNITLENKETEWSEREEQLTTEVAELKKCLEVYKRQKNPINNQNSIFDCYEEQTSNLKKNLSHLSNEKEKVSKDSLGYSDSSDIQVSKGASSKIILENNISAERECELPFINESEHLSDEESFSYDIYDIFKEMRINCPLSPIPEVHVDPVCFENKTNNTSHSSKLQLESEKPTIATGSESVTYKLKNDRYSKQRELKTKLLHRLIARKKVQDLYWRRKLKFIDKSKTSNSKITTDQKDTIKYVFDDSLMKNMKNKCCTENSSVKNIITVLADLVSQKLRYPRPKKKSVHLHPVDDSKNVLAVNRMLLRKAKESITTTNSCEKQEHSDQIIESQNPNSNTTVYSDDNLSMESSPNSSTSDRSSSELDIPVIDSCYESLNSNPPSIQNIDDKKNKIDWQHQNRVVSDSSNAGGCQSDINLDVSELTESHKDEKVRSFVNSESGQVKNSENFQVTQQLVNIDELTSSNIENEISNTDNVFEKNSIFENNLNCLEIHASNCQNVKPNENHNSNALLENMDIKFDEDISKKENTNPLDTVHPIIDNLEIPLNIMLGTEENSQNFDEQRDLNYSKINIDNNMPSTENNNKLTQMSVLPNVLDSKEEDYLKKSTVFCIETDSKSPIGKYDVSLINSEFEIDKNIPPSKNHNTIIEMGKNKSSVLPNAPDSNEEDYLKSTVLGIERDSPDVKYDFNLINTEFEIDKNMPFKNHNKMIEMGKNKSSVLAYGSDSNEEFYVETRVTDIEIDSQTKNGKCELHSGNSELEIGENMKSPGNDNKLIEFGQNKSIVLRNDHKEKSIELEYHMKKNSSNNIQDIEYKDEIQNELQRGNDKNIETEKQNWSEYQKPENLAQLCQLNNFNKNMENELNQKTLIVKYHSTKCLDTHSTHTDTEICDQNPFHHGFQIIERELQKASDKHEIEYSEQRDNLNCNNLVEKVVLPITEFQTVDAIDCYELFHDDTISSGLLEDYSDCTRSEPMSRSNESMWYHISHNGFIDIRKSKSYSGDKETHEPDLCNNDPNIAEINKSISNKRCNEEELLKVVKVLKLEDTSSSCAPVEDSTLEYGHKPIRSEVKVYPKNKNAVGYTVHDSDCATQISANKHGASMLNSRLLQVERDIVDDFELSDIRFSYEPVHDDLPINGYRNKSSLSEINIYHSKNENTKDSSYDNIDFVTQISTNNHVNKGSMALNNAFGNVESDIRNVFEISEDNIDSCESVNESDLEYRRNCSQNRIKMYPPSKCKNFRDINNYAIQMSTNEQINKYSITLNSALQNVEKVVNNVSEISNEIEISSESLLESNIEYRNKSPQGELKMYPSKNKNSIDCAIQNITNEQTNSYSNILSSASHNVEKVVSNVSEISKDDRVFSKPLLESNVEYRNKSTQQELKIYPSKNENSGDSINCAIQNITNDQTNSYSNILNSAVQNVEKVVNNVSEISKDDKISSKFLLESNVEYRNKSFQGKLEMYPENSGYSIDCATQINTSENINNDSILLCNAVQKVESDIGNELENSCELNYSADMDIDFNISQHLLKEECLNDYPSIDVPSMVYNKCEGQGGINTNYLEKDDNMPIKNLLEESETHLLECSENYSEKFNSEATHSESCLNSAEAIQENEGLGQSDNKKKKPRKNISSKNSNKTSKTVVSNYNLRKSSKFKKDLDSTVGESQKNVSSNTASVENNPKENNKNNKLKCVKTKTPQIHNKETDLFGILSESSDDELVPSRNSNNISNKYDNEYDSKYSSKLEDNIVPDSVPLETLRNVSLNSSNIQGNKNKFKKAYSNCTETQDQEISKHVDLFGSLSGLSDEECEMPRISNKISKPVADKRKLKNSSSQEEILHFSAALEAQKNVSYSNGTKNLQEINEDLFGTFSETSHDEFFPSEGESIHKDVALKQKKKSYKCKNQRKRKVAGKKGLLMKKSIKTYKQKSLAWNSSENQIIEHNDNQMKINENASNIEENFKSENIAQNQSYLIENNDISKFQSSCENTKTFINAPNEKRTNTDNEPIKIQSTIFKRSRTNSGTYSIKSVKATHALKRITKKIKTDSETPSSSCNEISDVKQNQNIAKCYNTLYDDKDKQNIEVLNSSNDFQEKTVSIKLGNTSAITREDSEQNYDIPVKKIRKSLINLENSNEHTNSNIILNTSLDKTKRYSYIKNDTEIVKHNISNPVSLNKSTVEKFSPKDERINILQEVVIRPSKSNPNNFEIHAPKQIRLGGFKRPNNSKIIPPCPLSPPLPTADEIVSHVEPVIIPLEKPAKMDPSKAAALFRKLITYSKEEKTVEEISKQFTSQETDHISRLILEQITQDTEKAKKDDTLAPLMTDTQRVMLGFMLKLEEMNVENLIDTYLKISEIRLLQASTLQEIDTITRLYVAICKSRKYIGRIRRMCCDAFYFMGDFAIPFFFIVLISWIQVLPMKQDMENFPMVKLLIQLVNLKSCNFPGYNLLTLRDLLSKYYQYPIEPWNIESFFKELFNEYLKNPVRPNDFAILLYCKNNSTKWVYEKINSLIRPTLEMIKKENLKATVIILIGNIISQFNGKVDSVYIESSRQWLKCMIEDEDLPKVIKDSIILSLRKLPKTQKNVNCK